MEAIVLVLVLRVWGGGLAEVEEWWVGSQLNYWALDMLVRVVLDLCRILFGSIPDLF
jgi:hypothetical protein